MTDGGIAGVGERTRLAIAEAGDIVLVTTEVLLFCGSVQCVRSVLVEHDRRGGNVLEFEGAELLVYDLPYDLV